MPTVLVRLGRRSYHILISAGLLDDVGQQARRCLGDRTRRAIVVSNPTVESSLGDRPYKSLARAHFEVHRFLKGSFATFFSFANRGKRFFSIGPGQSEARQVSLAG